MHFAPWMAAGTESLEAAFTQFIHDGFGDHAACRIAGADE